MFAASWHIAYSQWAAGAALCSLVDLTAGGGQWEGANKAKFRRRGEPGRRVGQRGAEVGQGSGSDYVAVHGSVAHPEPSQLPLHLPLYCPVHKVLFLLYRPVL